MASLVYPAGPPTTVCVMSPCASTSPSIRVGKRRPSVPSSVGPRGEVETGLPHRCRTGERDRLERLRVPRYRILSTQLRTVDHSARRSRKTEANREKKRESQDEPNVNTSNAHGAGGDHSSPVRPFQGRYTLYGGFPFRGTSHPGCLKPTGASGLADDRSGGRLLRGRPRMSPWVQLSDP